MTYKVVFLSRQRQRFPTKLWIKSGLTLVALHYRLTRLHGSGTFSACGLMNLWAKSGLALVALHVRLKCVHCSRCFFRQHSVSHNSGKASVTFTRSPGNLLWKNKRLKARLRRLEQLTSWKLIAANMVRVGLSNPDCSVGTHGRGPGSASGARLRVPSSPCVRAGFVAVG